MKCTMNTLRNSVDKSKPSEKGTGASVWYTLPPKTTPNQLSATSKPFPKVQAACLSSTQGPDTLHSLLRRGRGRTAEGLRMQLTRHLHAPPAHTHGTEQHPAPHSGGTVPQGRACFHHEKEPLMESSWTLQTWPCPDVRETAQATCRARGEEDASTQETELSVLYSRANSKGFIFSFLANPSTLLTKNLYICHDTLEVKQIKIHIQIWM